VAKWHTRRSRRCSSTELASQEQQQSINRLNRAGPRTLHSGQDYDVPRAKITQKGLQDMRTPIEDSLVDQAAQSGKQRMAPEQEARARGLARSGPFQTAFAFALEPTLCLGSTESPVIPSSASGVPCFLGCTAPAPRTARAIIRFTPAVDPELNLGDFIHMDDEPPESASAPLSPWWRQLPASLGESVAAGQGQGQLGVSTAITGISLYGRANRIAATCRRST